MFPRKVETLPVVDKAFVKGTTEPSLRGGGRMEAEWIAFVRGRKRIFPRFKFTNLIISNC